MSTPSETAPLLGNGTGHTRDRAVEPSVERAPRNITGLLRPDALRRPSMKSAAFSHHHDGDAHREQHSGNGDLIRDITIGFADGLTVPFALTAGLSTLGSTKLVVIGGLAELFSGSAYHGPLPLLRPHQGSSEA